MKRHPKKINKRMSLGSIVRGAFNMNRSFSYEENEEDERENHKNPSTSSTFSFRGVAEKRVEEKRLSSSKKTKSAPPSQNATMTRTS